MTLPLRGFALWLLAAVLLAAVAVAPCAALTASALSIENLQARVEAEPNNVKARYLLGRAYAEKGRHADAVAQFQAVLAVRPVPVVMFQLGVSLAKLGDLQKAVFQWDEIVKKYRPNNLTTLGYLGLALHKLATSADDESRRSELHMSALDYFKRILRIDPGNVKARLYAGAEYAKLGKLEQAAIQWLMAVRANPRNIQAWVLLTKALYKLQKLDKVRLAVNKILSLDASNIFAREMQSKLDTMTPQQRAEDAGKRPLPEEGDIPQVDPAKRPEEGVAPPVVVDKGPDVSTPDEDARGGDRPIPMADPPPPGSGDTGPNIEVEQLFLDGLDFKEKGNYEKALYSFLQAIDKDPKFSQIYLQLGEVYLSLAKLAPTKSQFEERIQLSLQALKKVPELAPGSLLAQASNAKGVLVGRLQKEGFSAYHLTTAQTAVTDERPEDAFEEYVLLLSNAVFNPEIFFDLGVILPKLTGGNMQDLQFFLEELYGQHKENYLVEYLLAKTYARLGKNTEAVKHVGLFVEHAEVLAPHIAKFIARTSMAKTDPIDLIVSAKLLIKRQDRREALNRLVEFLKVAPKNDLFYSEATKLRSSIGELLDAGMSKSFEEEKKEVVGEIPRMKALFGEYYKPEQLDDKMVEDLKVFLTNRPENMLARFMFGWVNRVFAPRSGQMQADMERSAEDTLNDLLNQKANSPEWHLALGLQALQWGLPDNARSHLKVSGDLLLARGQTRSTAFANQALTAASRLIDARKLDEAAILLDQARVYDYRSLNYFLVKYRYLLGRGQSIEALYIFWELASTAVGDPWFRLVLFTDLGLILFRATLLALLLTSGLLVVRYFEDLHHLLSELWRQKGLLLPFSLAISIFLVLVFPTGLVVFLPALTWPMLRAEEKRIFLSLVGLLVLVPMLLPVSLADNFELLRTVERVRAGETTGARDYFEKFLKSHPGDYNATFLGGLIGMQDGDPAGLDSAEKTFKELSKRYPSETGPLINLGNLLALKGDTTGAFDAYNKALGKNPANTPALYNISAVYQRAAQTENFEKYLRWARTVARPEDQLGRYEAIAFNPPRLALMNAPLPDEKLGGYFSISGTLGLMSMDPSLMLFLGWFVFGGGLVGFLIFTRERLDVLMRRCYHCLRIVCNNCQKVHDQKAFCLNCADEAGRKRISTRDRHQELQALAFKKAAIFNLLMPGAGYVFLDRVAGGVLFGLLFYVLSLLAISGGGWLSNFLYQPVDSGPLTLLRTLLSAGVLVLFALVQFLFFRARSRISGT